MRINKDSEYLDKLRDYYARNKVLPSFTTIARLICISTASVSLMVDRMKRTGHLESTPEKRLQPGPRFFESVLLGTAQAGSPMSATDNQPVSIDIVSLLLKNPSKSYLLRVSGDSMEDAGIRSDDYVVVMRGAKAGVGDIVVAQVDGEYTVKYLGKDKKGSYLKAGNKAHKDIRPKDTLKIFGVVTGSFRSYNLRHAA